MFIANLQFFNKQFIDSSENMSNFLDFSKILKIIAVHFFKSFRVNKIFLIFYIAASIVDSIELFRIKSTNFFKIRIFSELNKKFHHKNKLR